MPGTVRASPSPGGEGRGEGERLSNPIFGLGGGPDKIAHQPLVHVGRYEVRREQGNRFDSPSQKRADLLLCFGAMEGIRPVLLRDAAHGPWSNACVHHVRPVTTRKKIL